jgi:hypothetical protein
LTETSILELWFLGKVLGSLERSTKLAGSCGEKSMPPKAKRTKSKSKGNWKELVAQQGTKPIEDLDKFMEEFGDSSPDETADEMIAEIRALRREGTGRKRSC